MPKSKNPKIKIKVKSSGQECPLHTSKIKSPTSRAENAREMGYPENPFCRLWRYFVHHAEAEGAAV